MNGKRLTCEGCAWRTDREACRACRSEQRIVEQRSVEQCVADSDMWRQVDEILNKTDNHGPDPRD